MSDGCFLLHFVARGISCMAFIPVFFFFCFFALLECL